MLSYHEIYTKKLKYCYHEIASDNEHVLSDKPK